MSWFDNKELSLEADFIDWNYVKKIDKIDYLSKNQIGLLN